MKTGCFFNENALNTTYLGSDVRSKGDNAFSIKTEDMSEDLLESDASGVPKFRA